MHRSLQRVEILEHGPLGPAQYEAAVARSEMTQLDTWENCYDKGWKGIALDASMAHPAKFSRGLIFRIVEHALAEGMIQPGQTVLDPFGGICAGALPCLQYGLHWVGVELESKFVELGRENIALWNARYAAHFPNWGTARVLAGDSRRLCEVVGAAGLVVSSPPYAESLRGDNKPDYDRGKIEAAKESGVTAQRSTWGVTNSVGVLTGKGYGSADGNLGNLPPGDIQAVISSPPFAGNTGGRGEASRNGIDAALFDRHSGGMKKGTGDDPANLDHLPMGQPPVAIVSSPPYVDSMEKSGGIDPAKSNHIGGPHSQMNRSDTRYGESDGQMGAMKAGNISAVIASPPFADSVGSDDPDKRGGLFRDEKRRNDVNLTGTYGETEGQLGAMKAGEVGAVVSSPPYEGSIINSGSNGIDWEKAGRPDRTKPSPKRISPGVDGGLQYGSTDGQIGATQGQTFWEAARLIVEQCALLLPPGGAAIWVVKGYIKNGQYVDFPGQWQQLCEACGFETVHIHRAMLVKENGEQATMAAGHDTTGTTTNLLGEEVTTAGKALANKKNRTERKSFFRRLHERRRPDLAIDFETVLCMVKREAA